MGLVAGEAIMGANIVRDLFASITNIVGGRSGAYEEKLVQARQFSIDEMESKARSLGANDVIGIDIDYEVVREGILMVTSSGTAVFFWSKKTRRLLDSPWEWGYFFLAIHFYRCRKSCLTNLGYR